MIILSELQTTEKLWGIIVYEILDSGYLNGLWTNNDGSKKNNTINEVARKRQGETQKLEGEYTVAYVKQDGVTFSGILIITMNQNGTYQLQWKISRYAKTPVLYEGTGIKTINNQLITIYWQIKSI